MKLGILSASVSNNAGGIFGAMVGQNKALQRFFDMTIEVFGLQDELTQQDLASWYPLHVTTCAVRGPDSFGYSPTLVAALQEANLDLVHIHGLWMYPSIAGSTWARSEQKPYLISPHGMLDPWALRNSAWKKKVAKLLYESAHLRGAACIHAVSHSEARSIRAYGLTNPICVIPNGIDFAPQSMSAPVAHKDERKRLLYLGRLHPKKNLLSLLRAWRQLKKQGELRTPEWSLTIAGWSQGGYQEELQQFCTKSGIDDSVHFVGPLFGSDKDSVYRKVDALILPSLSEGLPVAVLEAWSYRLPVLITPECNFPEGFDAEAAIRIGTESEKIASGISQLIVMTDSERQAMGERGMHLVEKKFSWNKIAREMHSVYQWMLGSGEKPDCVRTT
jgi:glycosyltransferase involved in cell wall biosynthesis